MMDWIWAIWIFDMTTNITVQEKRKSLENAKAEIVEARVIANYGDPGLDENYHFDFLSRFVIVAIESVYRIPTKNRWQSKLAIVLRPKHLWINIEGSNTGNTASQKRSDALGNLNAGDATGYSVAGIPKMNDPYQIGEIIKIKKLAEPLKVGASNIFNSAFQYSNSSVPSYLNYGVWHTAGSSIPYIQPNTNALTEKTIGLPDQRNPMTLCPRLNKYQYEAFMLSVGSNYTNGLVEIFAKTLPPSHSIYNADGGYLFNNAQPINFHVIEYEDINAGNKQRVATSECMPLVVATPNSFPTPKIREIGTISYNPTYSPIIVR